MNRSSSKAPGKRVTTNEHEMSNGGRGSHSSPTLSDPGVGGLGTLARPTDEEADIVIKSDPLQRELYSRQIQMIAISGAIGGSLFIGSGPALQLGGPGSLVVGYMVVGLMVLLTMHALSELAVAFPVNGGFYSYVVRFVDPSWGFAVGGIYAIGFVTLLSFELTAASISIRFWRTDIKEGIFTTVFLVSLALIQVFSVRGFGEVEFVLGAIKIIVCVGFIVLGIIVDCGGVGHQGYLGTRYWRDPGAFRNGINGFSGVFVYAALAFGGTELVGLAAAESHDPTRAIPRAGRRVFWRISILYVVNVLVLGLVVSADDPRLTSSLASDTRASPFVLAIEDASIRVLPSIFNAAILLSVLSVANSTTFGATRTLQALAARGMAPAIFAYVDPKGRPLWCILVHLSSGMLAYIGLSGHASDVFDWILAVSGLAYLFVWLSICVAHIRFRHAWVARGHRPADLPYRAPTGIYGSSVSVFLNVSVLAASVLTAIRPTPSAPFDIAVFFRQILTIPILLVLYLGWKLYTHDWRLYIALADMDIDNRRVLPELDPNHVPVHVVPWWRKLFGRLFDRLFRRRCTST